MMRAACAIVLTSAVKVHRSDTKVAQVFQSVQGPTVDDVEAPVEVDAANVSSNTTTNSTDVQESGGTDTPAVNTSNGSSADGANATFDAAAAEGDASSVQAALDGAVSDGALENSTEATADVNATESDLTGDSADGFDNSSEATVADDNATESDLTSDNADGSGGTVEEEGAEAKGEDEKDANEKTGQDEGREPKGDAPKCVTKEDERAVAWWGETAPAGTPCVFGVDPRDEGLHCIFETEFGSYGWCYTDTEMMSWGSCNKNCPLFGPYKALAGKLDGVDKQVGDLLKKVKGLPRTPNVVAEKTPAVQDDGVADEAEEAETTQELPGAAPETTEEPAETMEMAASEITELPADEAAAEDQSDTSPQKPLAMLASFPQGKVNARPALRIARMSSRIPTSHSGFVLLQEAAPRIQGLAVEDDEAVCNALP